MTRSTPSNQSKSERGTGKPARKTTDPTRLRAVRIIGSQERDLSKRVYCHHCEWYHQPWVVSDHEPGRLPECDECWPNEYGERGHDS